MILKKNKINDCYLIFPKKKIDKRGSFHRSFCKNFLKNNKINFDIKQCNISINKKKYTLRGFHYQKKTLTEYKIISVISGSIFNVSIDLRRNSSSFLKKNLIRISSNSNSLLLIPAGVANAFLTLSNNTIVQYFMSSFFEKENKKNYSGFRYDDKFFNIKWPTKPLVISSKDLTYKSFSLINFDK